MEKVKRLFDIPYYQLEHYPNDDCLVDKRKGKWEKTSTQEFVDQANLISQGLLDLGIKPGDKIATITSSNRSEWNIMDIGILQIGAINVPVYPTISENDYKFIFNDAEVKLCFLSDKELYDKVNAIKNEVSTLTDIYSFNKIEGVKNWKEVIEKGKIGGKEKVEGIKATIKEDDLATLIYTSGTTGVPKGVMLSHKNIVSNSIASIERIPVDSTGKALSFLPICHVYERMLQYLYMLQGISIYFAESMETIGDNLKEVGPNVFTAVPRLLEKVYDKIVARGAELTGIKKALFYWALELGLRYELHGANGWWYEFQLSIARKLIFKKWQEALGGNAQAVASGSAALQPRLARVFTAAGIPIFEGYGLTETSPVVSVNSNATGIKFGSVGRVLKGVEVKIAEDGEILVKGPNVMMGYYKRQDFTDEVMRDGWFHTGDKGTLDNEGFLSITGRKKEIFKTSGGKYIAPELMQNKFKESRFIEQIMIIGEGEKHPSALIVPSFPFLEEWCKRKNIPWTNPKEMVCNEKVVARLEKEVAEFNSSFGDWEKIKKYELIGQEWGIDTGELTPTLKIKRKVVMEKYKPLIDKIYNR